MIKNYFCNLGNIFKNSFIFFKDTFKNTLKIWWLILLQVVIMVPTVAFYQSQNSIFETIFAIVGFILFVSIFVYMFKQIFNLASKCLEKDKITNKKAIFSLIVIGILRMLPILLIGPVIYSLHIPLEIQKILNPIIFLIMILYYFALSLTVVAIVNWQDRNIFYAIIQGVKIFFKKFLLSFPTILATLIISSLISIILPMVICNILALTKLFSFEILNIAFIFIKMLSAFTIVGFYVGIQTNLIKENKD